MLKKERFMIVTLKNIEMRQSDARLLRGFFANQDVADDSLHNHTATGDSIYRYPVIQYKIIKNKPVIVAYGEGIRSIHKHLMQMDELRIGSQVFRNVDMDIQLRERPIGDCREPKTYLFATPWLALNQENYKKYRKMEEQDEKDALLSGILIGNILSLCKGFDVTIEQRIQVEHHLQEMNVSYKGEHMLGFQGTFTCNCCLPSLCGIGKGTSRGFGTIRLIKEQEKEEVGHAT